MQMLAVNRANKRKSKKKFPACIGEDVGQPDRNIGGDKGENSPVSDEDKASPVSDQAKDSPESDGNSPATDGDEDAIVGGIGCVERSAASSSTAAHQPSASSVVDLNMGDDDEAQRSSASSPGTVACQSSTSSETSTHQLSESSPVAATKPASSASLPRSVLLSLSPPPLPLPKEVRATVPAAVSPGISLITPELFQVYFTEERSPQSGRPTSTWIVIRCLRCEVATAKRVNAGNLRHEYVGLMCKTFLHLI